MSEADKRKRDKEELSELYRKVEHARNEDIALRAISIAEYWISKAEKQAIQIQNLERRNKRKNGKWIETDSHEPCWYKCDQCGRLHDFLDNYCPNCGSYNGGETWTE